MPIHGLTGQSRQWPRIGVLRKGGPSPGNRPGKDLDHFRFTSEIPAVMQAFREIYGDTPREIDVVLPYATADEVFETWQEQWGQSGIEHRCDGLNVVLMRQPDATVETWALGEGPECPGGCTKVGRLHLFLPQLIVESGAPGTVMMATSSVNEIKRIDGALRAYEGVPGLGLSMAPFILSRRSERISVPIKTKDGKRRRQRLAKWMVHLEPKGEWVREQLADAMAKTALVDAPPPMIVDEETGEVMQGDLLPEEVTW